MTVISSHPIENMSSLIKLYTLFSLFICARLTHLPYYINTDVFNHLYRLFLKMLETSKNKIKTTKTNRFRYLNKITQIGMLFNKIIKQNRSKYKK